MKKTRERKRKKLGVPGKGKIKNLWGHQLTLTSVSQLVLQPNQLTGGTIVLFSRSIPFA